MYTNICTHMYSHTCTRSHMYTHICTCTHTQVEDVWKTTEFVLFPHRESKDVFILGGTDDIQVLLDDSQVGTR